MKRSAPESSHGRGTNPKRMTQSTAGEKEWKWNHYFGEVDPTIRSQIEMDDVALFSVTVDKDADVITSCLSQYLPRFATICDATACVGGNTMSFAKFFKNVTSVEMDRGRYEMLTKNVTLLGYQNRVHPVNADFLRFKETMPYFDFIFFDPPFVFFGDFIVDGAERIIRIWVQLICTFPIYR